MFRLLRELVDHDIWQSREIFFNSSLDRLPLLRKKISSQCPRELMLLLISSYDPLLDMGATFTSIVKKWLSLHGIVDIDSFCHVVRFSDQQKKMLFIAEIVVQLDENVDISFVDQKFSLLVEQVKQAITLPDYLKFLLNAKSAINDSKIEEVSYLLLKAMRKAPHRRRESMLRLLYSCYFLFSHEFNLHRKNLHIARLISSFFFLKRNVERMLNEFPWQRSLQIRSIFVRIQSPFGSKQVLSCFVVFFLPHGDEVFEERYLARALQVQFPDLLLMKETLFFHSERKGKIEKVYFELEKKNGKEISLDEKKKIKAVLPTVVKSCIRKLSEKPLSIDNPEELFKNILVLSNEISHPLDFPQVLLLFKGKNLYQFFFELIIVRLVKDNSSMKDLLSKVKTDINWLIRKNQIVGYLFGKYPKEASVLEIVLSEGDFAAKEGKALDLYLVREKIFRFLNRCLGEVRDYNGGSLVERQKLLKRTLSSFQKLSKDQIELLEEVFYSIIPIDAQIVLSSDVLIKLFEILLSSLAVRIAREEEYCYKKEIDASKTYLVVRTSQKSIKEFFPPFSNLMVDSLISSFVERDGFHYAIFICQTSSEEDGKQWVDIFESAIFEWFKSLRKEQKLRLSFEHLPVSLDPRLWGDRSLSVIFKMLYEGLVRIGINGNPELALAESVSISEDLKRYRFQIRDTCWSDGSKLLAKDFEQAWKQILSPHLRNRLDFLFYPIKNSLSVKEGLLPSSELGVSSIGDDCLVVDLEFPFPGFLELVAHPFCSPVSFFLDKKDPGWVTKGGVVYSCNGPFRLHKVEAGLEYSLVKNEKYWDVGNVSLESISITKNDSSFARELYEKERIEWIGRPVSSCEIDSSPDKTVRLVAQEFAFHCFLNTEFFLFRNVKIRRALFLAIDPEEFAQLSPRLLPAFSLTPFNLYLSRKRLPVKEARILSRRLFTEGLEELGIGEMPNLTLIFSGRELQRKSATLICEQWKEVLGIRCNCRFFEWGIEPEELISGYYQISQIGWFSPLRSAEYTLNFFKHKNRSSNIVRWESKEYQAILDRASREVDPSSREIYFSLAEEFLMEQAVVFPLYYEADNHKRKTYLKNVVRSGGLIDFKSAYIEKDFDLELCKKMNLA